MGLFKLVHDIMGIDGRKISSSLRGAAKSARKQKSKLRNCDRVRRMKIN